MTFLALSLFGVGLILVGSGLDNTPIGETFAKIILGKELDWTGNGTSTASGQSASLSGGGSAKPTAKPVGSIGSF